MLRKSSNSSRIRKLFPFKIKVNRNGKFSTKLEEERKFFQKKKKRKTMVHKENLGGVIRNWIC